MADVDPPPARSRTRAEQFEDQQRRRKAAQAALYRHPPALEAPASAPAPEAPPAADVESVSPPEPEVAPAGPAAAEPSPLPQAAAPPADPPSPAPLPAATPAVQPTPEPQPSSLLAPDPLTASEHPVPPPVTVLLRVVEGSDTGREFALSQGTHIIGRRDPKYDEEDQPDLMLSPTTVSRHHARLVVSPSAVTIRDLGSKNKTRVNRELVKGARTLQVGDRLRLGGATLEVVQAPES